MKQKQTPTVYHFDNDDNQKGVLHGVSSCYADWEVNGDRTLNAHTTSSVAKEDRLVLIDKRGDWREYIVADAPDDDTGTGADLICLESLDELTGHFIEDRRPTGGPNELLEAAIEGTRWESAGCDIVAEPVTQVWYHTNSRKIIDRVASTFGGEIFTEYVVEGAKVTHRRVGIRKRLGEDRGKRYTYGHNLLGVSREWGTDRVFTRVWGYGSGVEATDDDGNLTGGYTRRINFGDINGGKRYVESDEARLRWGIPDGHGGKVHSETDVVFEECKDPAELLQLTTEWAEAQYEPQPSYSINPYFLEEEPPHEGDDVTIIDKMFDPPLRTKARISKGHEDYCEPENDTYTVGKVPPLVVDTLADQDEQHEDLSDRVGGIEGNSDAWNASADNTENMPGKWLQQMMDRINQEMDAAKTYKFTSFEKGDIWANGPLTEDGKPDGATAAIALNGLGFRISSKVQNGDFVWTTFGTGEGFTANVINVGTLRCGDNYLNLDTGEMRIALTAKVGSGSTTLSGYVSDTAADAAKDYTDEALEAYVPTKDFNRYLTFENTFNALTHNGVDQGLFTQNGQLYINASYVRTGIISGNTSASHGRTLWDLDQGYLQNAMQSYIAGQSHTNIAYIGDGNFKIIMDVTTLGDWTSATLNSNPNVHFIAFRSYNGIIWGAPGTNYVGFFGPESTGTSYSVQRDFTQNTIAAVESSGTSVTFTKQDAHFRQGMLCSVTTTGTYSVEF